MIDVRAAADVLRAGGLVAFPTETVYGLGADATNRAALRRLFAVKGRPPDHPVIVHLAAQAQLSEWAAAIPPAARALADRFWPGPLTLVLERTDRVPDEVTGGRATVGLRVPDQRLAQALLAEFGGGLAAPSANRFGRVSPTTAADVRADLGDEVDLVLDGGPCRIGVESTIVACTGEGVALVRLGGITRAEIEAVVGATVVRSHGEIAAPGTREVHYAPDVTVELVDASALGSRAEAARAAGERVGVLALDPSAVPAGVEVLDPPRDIDDYAHVLYARLREADHRGLQRLLVVAPPPVGIGATVVDRLRRAAASAVGEPA